MATLTVGSGGAYATIQAAVDASSAGDSIVISSGTYQEQVVVSGKSNLSIGIASGANVVVKAPDDVTQTATSTSGRAINAIVTVVNSDNVSLSGFDVDGNGRGATADGNNANYVGIAYRNSSGGTSNVDVTGIRWGYESGTTAGGRPVVNGVQSGVGVVVDNADGAQKNFSMSGGTIADFQKNGTVFLNANLNVSGVTINGGGAQPIIAQNGFQAGDNCSGTITGCTVNGIGYAGNTPYYASGFITYATNNLTISNNVVLGANSESTDAKLYGIYVDGYGAYGAASANNVRIVNNTISHADTAIGGYAGPIFGDDYGSFTGTGTITGNLITNLDTSNAAAVGVEFYARNQSGNFTVAGSAYNDYFEGGNGNDSFTGGDGNDTFYTSAGNDVYSGGNGIDLVDYSLATSAVTVSLARTTAQSTLGAGTDTLTGIENLIGSAYGDTLTGSSGDNVISGGDGNDNINGGAGNDTINGDGGNDILNGGAGDDLINGGAGNDTITGSTGINTLNGDAGDDRITGGSDVDNISGGAGNDTLNGGAGNDVILGNADNDTINAGAGDDVVNGGTGKDILFGGTGNDTFVFAAGDSGITTATRDEIRDFTIGGDKIDLSSLAITSNDINLLTISGVTNRVILQIDSNHDSIFDMQVQVTLTNPVAGPLSAADIIF